MMQAAQSSRPALLVLGHCVLLITEAALSRVEAALTTMSYDSSTVHHHLKTTNNGSAVGSSPSNPARYLLAITAGQLYPAPDCFDRKVILVNGKFMPTLELTQGDWVEIIVRNNIPKSWPAMTGGITLHWHGFSMRGFQDMHGTRYVSQRPIAPGSSFTYRFQVNEMPGTYIYHDHAAMYRADGLQGALIVRERPGTPLLHGQVHSEDTLLLTDWWHFPGNSLAMRLSRPMDPSKQSDGSGSWCWVGLPRAILINGRGNYFECEDVFKREVGSPLPFRPAASPVVAQEHDLMLPTPCLAGQLGPEAEPSMCSIRQGASAEGESCAEHRTRIKVTPGATHRLRLINAAMLVYMTVCVEKHTLTVVALDAAPVTPKSFKECVDIDMGQRVDVLLTADQPAGSYWVSVGSQYRKGSPIWVCSGYAVLQYKGATAPPHPDNIMQPAEVVSRRWTTAEWLGFTTPQELLNPAPQNGSAAAAAAAVAPYLAPANSGQTSWKLPKQEGDKRFVIQATQPLMEHNGIVKWALDNVAHSESPPCKAVIQEVREQYSNLQVEVMSSSSSSKRPLNPKAAMAQYFTPMGGNSAMWVGTGGHIQVIDISRPEQKEVANLMHTPVPGKHVLTITGEQPMVELVIQNNRAGLYGGEYASLHGLTDNRRTREQHSFHLHGFHFWLVGMGAGEWTPDKVNGPDYNLDNPHMRDTATLLLNGTTEDRAAWVAFRFLADNPGVWPMHCHIAWHEIMGQGLNIIVNPAAIAETTPPDDMPSCPSPCLYDFANFNPKAALEVYGQSSMLVPDNANLP